MKNLTLTLFLLITGTHIFAQWQWAKAGGGANSWDYGNSITNDTAGNAYVIGSFSSTTISFGSLNLTNAGVSTDDVFLTKYSTTGNPIWAIRAGGTNHDFGRAVTADAFGNIYITGHYYSDTIVFGNDTLFNTGVTDIYTVKYSINGNVLWARNGGGNSFDESNAICTDASGNVYIAGQFTSGSMMFGTQTVTNFNADTLDMFILKYDALGNVVWVRSAGGYGNDAITGISTDLAGNVIVTGSSGSPVCYFGPVTLTNPGIFGYSDVFIVKYNNAGTAIWGRSGAGAGFEEGTGVSIDASNNIYITGLFTSILIVFGNDTLYNARTIGGPTDIFIVKYNSSGTELWARRAGTRYNDDAYGIVIDASGNACITGDFSDTVLTLGSYSLPNMGAKDIFVANYNASGNVVSAYSAGDTGDDKSYSISMDNNSSIYIAGEFYSSNPNFGLSSLHNAGAGYSDMFIAKVALSTDISELQTTNSELIIYPNPSTGKFQVSSTKHKIESIKVFNSLGEPVESDPLSFFQGEGSGVRSLGKGVYFIQLKTENNFFTKKLIIQ